VNKQAMISITGPSQQAYSFSDLSMNEIKELVKFFFTAVLACCIIFGVWIFVPLYWWIGTEGSESSPGWSIPGWVGILIPLFLIIYIIRNLDYSLEWFEKFFENLRNLTKGLSATQRTAFVLLLIAYFYSASKYPVYWYLFTVLIFVPVGYTIDRYKKIIAHKSKLKELYDKARGLNKTGDLVALLLQRMQKGIKVGCSSKDVCRPIAKKIEGAEEELAVEYKKGQKDLEELLLTAYEFRELVGRWY